jgi:8-oxo-dGTP diphosphatase
LPPTADLPLLDVVAAVLHDGHGRVLVTQRPAGKPHAGLWEFPGGKRHRGETEVQCLVRELREELGVDVAPADCTPLLNLEHRYPDRLVQLHVWSVAHFAGDPSGREGQDLRWLAPAELDSVPLLPADGPIVKCLLRAAGTGRMAP